MFVFQVQFAVDRHLMSIDGMSSESGDSLQRVESLLRELADFEEEAKVNTIIIEDFNMKFVYTMVGSISHAIASGMHYVVCISIPYGHICPSSMPF